MAVPWFDPAQAGVYFGIAGAALGTIGGILGAISGHCAPRGQGRRWVLGAYWALFGLGCATVCLGGVALVSRQPYGVWWPFLLLGGIMAAVTGGLIPIVRRRYSEVECRRMQAAGIRNS